VTYFGYALVSWFVAALWLTAFLISFLRERRRLRNGIYLFMTVFFGAGGAASMLAYRSTDAANTAVLVIAGLVLLCLVVLVVFLIGNGVVMLRREGRRPANLLSLLAGTGIAALVGVGLLVGPISWPPLVIARNVVVALLCYFAFLFTCYLLYSVVYGHVRYRGAVDFVVVLGSGLLGSRVPPLLASRLDRARAVVELETARGRSPVVITSGGQGPGEDLPESHAMARYLVDHGISEDRILMEDRSTTTLENMTFSRNLMREAKPQYRCLVVTNNFHVLRAALTANRAGLNGQVIGSRTAFYFWPSATIREFVAVLLFHKVINSAVCVAIVVWLIAGSAG
jgi:uncharacterized SAM-binding protein YcdF (DUF218 family)